MKRRHTVDVVFALGLFLVFAVSVLLVLLSGAEVVASVQDSSAERVNERVCLPYIATKVRHYDEAGRIRKGQFGGGDALVMTEEADGMEFVTYLYCSGGKLRELFCEKNAELDAAAGEEIGDAAALEIEERDGGLISVTCRYDDKESDSILLYVRSGQEGLS